MDRVKKLEILLEFGKKIQAERNIEKLIKLLTEEATELLEAERATVFVLDKEKKKLWSLVGLGLDKQKIEIPMNEGIAGYVATTGESLNVPNAYKDERFNKEIDKKTGFRTKTILAVPIRNLKGEIMGVFQVLNKKDTTFNEEDEETVNMLASQAGVAIGLAMSVYEEFSHLGPEGQNLGLLIINVITATTFIVQIIGPPFVKYALARAGEIEST